MRVLVVDDDPVTVAFVRTLLSGEGLTVCSASNGAEALQRLERVRFEAIILDLQMPVMDGHAFYRELRARHDTTPVVVLSAQGARLAQRELGAEAAVEKPFAPEQLLAALQSLGRSS